MLSPAVVGLNVYAVARFATKHTVWNWARFHRLTKSVQRESSAAVAVPHAVTSVGR
jgi:hypothetical protein